MADSFEIDFLPVGENARSGESICIRYGSIATGYHIHVVDGGYANTTETIIQHLANHYGRPRRIENVVLTHADGDHAPGLIGILENYEIGALWMNRPWLYASEVLHHFHGNWTIQGLIDHLRAEYSTLVTLENIALKKGIPIYDPLQGARIGPFVVLAPSRERYVGIIPDLDKSPDVYTKSVTDWFSETIKKAVALVRETWIGETLSDCPDPTSASNESSVVHAAVIDGQAIVLTGDVGPAGLTEAADYAAHFNIFQPAFIQVPHHGSRRNVTPITLNRWLGSPVADSYTRRGTAFCSAAAADPDHPKKKVVNAFLRRGYPVHTTNGIAKNYHHNFPARPGWSSSVPEPFSTEVEE
jgi:beta-lactamase superfamily II metal-dependent hydrolase